MLVTRVCCGDLLHLEHDALDVAKPVGLGETQLLGNSRGTIAIHSTSIGASKSINGIGGSSSGGQW